MTTDRGDSARTDSTGIDADGIDTGAIDTSGGVRVGYGDLEDLAQSVADQTTSFLIAVREIAAGASRSGDAVPLLLLEVSQLLLAGARLGAQVDFVPDDDYEPDVGPDPDLDRVREALATILGEVDEYAEVFDPYVIPPEIVRSRISDDVAATAGSVAQGLKHHAEGRIHEALWWWQFGYVSAWGNEASAALRALQSIVSHHRLDTDDLDASLEPLLDPV